MRGSIVADISCEVEELLFAICAILWYELEELSKVGWGGDRSLGPSLGFPCTGADAWREFPVLSSGDADTCCIFPELSSADCTFLLGLRKLTAALSALVANPDGMF